MTKEEQIENRMLMIISLILLAISIGGGILTNGISKVFFAAFAGGILFIYFVLFVVFFPEYYVRKRKEQEK